MISSDFFELFLHALSVSLQYGPLGYDLHSGHAVYAKNGQQRKSQFIHPAKLTALRSRLGRI